MDKKLLEQREDGLYKLTESMLIKPQFIKKINLSEQTSKVLYEGKEYKAVSIYSFPVSRPGQKNYNERIYTESLWNRIIKEKMGENSYGLMGHPEDDGNPEKAWCVWKNVRLEKINNELFTMADAWLFGPHGRQVNEGIEAGGGVGLSTVGYGDFEEDGVTIRENDYELSRVADHVLEPSYGVFGTLEDIKENKIKKKEEEKESEIKIIEKNKDLLSEKSNTNIITIPETLDTVKEAEIKFKDNEMSDKTNKLVEKNFRFFVEAKIKEVNDIEDLKERYNTYKELLNNFDEDASFADDIKEKIEKKISAVKEELDTLVDKGKELDTVKESGIKLSEELKIAKEEIETLKKEMETVQKKLDEASKLLEDTKLYTNKLRDLYEINKAEKNGMITATEYKELSVYNEEKEEENKKLKQEIIELKKEKEEEKKNDKKDDDEDKKNNNKDKKDDEKDNDEKENDKKDKKDEDEDEDEKKNNKKESFTLDLRNDVEVNHYYLDLEKFDPRVKMIKEDILKCRTLMEAQRTYLRLKDIYEDDPSPYKQEAIGDSKEKPKLRPQTVKFKNVKRKGWF